ncbi:hypothetical protein H6F88_12190 [Oculatella sp. FACHB-28]|uniref:hypothetical protein n=1 Tax=Cyanophyceae TaxID=3028117 RepID=UPI00168956A9|nr:MULTISPECIES: hypothetical protein [Cyanophyceae]MBD2000671.1 hypothetical protein [Leptolyngbya sp. FACHB-541]MBD2056762.1 hypothetical protein [Oculatella sp. FACHB-28]
MTFEFQQITPQWSACMGVVRLRSLTSSMSMVRFQKSIGGVAGVVLRNAPYKIGDRTNGDIHWLPRFS